VPRRTRTAASGRCSMPRPQRRARAGDRGSPRCPTAARAKPSLRSCGRAVVRACGRVSCGRAVEPPGGRRKGVEDRSRGSGHCPPGVWPNLRSKRSQSTPVPLPWHHRGASDRATFVRPGMRAWDFLFGRDGVPTGQRVLFWTQNERGRAAADLFGYSGARFPGFATGVRFSGWQSRRVNLLTPSSLDLLRGS
jgi:hypothetical protein